MRYGEAFKERMVAKVLRPGGAGLAHAAREARVREETLSRWVAEARRLRTPDPAPEYQWWDEWRVELG